jgi:cardiolipin synthase
MLDWIMWFFLFLAAFSSAGHALLHKRDPRAGLGWIVTCLALPGFGALLYWLLGVNRIRTRARDWRARGQGMPWEEPRLCPWSIEESASLPFLQENYSALLSLSDAVTRRNLLPGNRVTPLHNGEEAYPAMLDAIRSARRSVHLSTYIFDSDGTGRQFVEVLAGAADRGVEVLVLIDALGERYSLPTARRLLRGSKVRVARFLPPSLSGRGIYFNLRNHRKLLVVDGEVGFAGGMNLGDRHLAGRTENPRRVCDIHFQVAGPAVGQLQEAFLEDWHFATGESLPILKYPSPLPDGEAFCRGISAGPNEDFEALTWIVVGALNSARHKVRIMTPYFIPDRALITAINAASLRGVEVDVILPQQNNLPYVGWAASAFQWELLQYGTRIFSQPPPFVHSKLLLVDGHYALVGSANLDPRSLRLNFEFNLEVYDRGLTTELSDHFDRVMAGSHRIFLAEVDSRPLPQKLRDSFAKLFSPYL